MVPSLRALIKKVEFSSKGLEIILSRTSNEFLQRLFELEVPEIEDGIIKIGDLELKYDLQYFGENPINGWSLYFSLRGGGGVANTYNENQWHRHKELYEL